jgi:pimeloyl-ACP methyl ester carboxylesterase
LADGLERSTGRRAAIPPLDIAFYGDLFLPAAVGESKGQGDSADPEWDLAKSDMIAVRAAAAEVLSEDELAAAAEETAVKGLGRVPRPLQAVVAAMDRRFGARAGALFIGELRQVLRYLLDADLKARTHARVMEAMTEDCRILIGHSLGSVVAFEFLRQHPKLRLDLLLTLGSPLGLQTIRHHMPDPEFGSTNGIPDNVGMWVNLRDLRDPVACAGSLTRWWPRIHDGIVDNGRDAHAVERYLGKKATGDAVLTVAPELAL